MSNFGKIDMEPTRRKRARVRNLAPFHLTPDERGGTHRVPLEEVFRELGAFLHAHEHLGDVAQRVSPQGFRARGRVQARRGYDGGAVPRAGKLVLQPRDHLQDPLVPVN